MDVDESEAMTIERIAISTKNHHRSLDQQKIATKVVTPITGPKALASSEGGILTLWKVTLEAEAPVHQLPRFDIFHNFNENVDGRPMENKDVDGPRLFDHMVVVERQHESFQIEILTEMVQFAKGLKGNDLTHFTNIIIQL